MINIPQLIGAYWANDKTLPKLWLEYVPLDQVVADGLPFAQMEIAAFAREQLNCGMAIDTYRIRVNCFHKSAPEAFTLGQQALAHIGQWKHPDIHTGKSRPEDFATPVEAGKRIVWVFGFSSEFKLMESY